VQHCDQEHGDGLAEVEQQLGFRVGEDLARLAQVGLEVVIAAQPVVVDTGDVSP
jgi:hypothetical protein